MTRYGRCMSKQDAKELKENGQLFDHGTGLVPVFDNPISIENKLKKKMSKDQLQNYFRKIGVRNPQTIVFFEVDNTIGIVGPITQTNGLREYKIPEGTRINIYGSIRI